MDYLKTTEGSSLPMNTLIDMAAQARHFVFFVFFTILLIAFIYSFTPCSLSMILPDRKVATAVMSLTFKTNLVITI